MSGSGSQTPLYVRLSEEPSRRLEQAVSATGKSKRQLVEEAVSQHLGDDGLVVGRVALHEEAPVVMTLHEAADLLRVAPRDLKSAAGAGKVPARRIGGKWRFGRRALLAWLEHAPEPVADQFEAEL